MCQTLMCFVNKLINLLHILYSLWHYRISMLKYQLRLVNLTHEAIRAVASLGLPRLLCQKLADVVQVVHSLQEVVLLVCVVLRCIGEFDAEELELFETV